MLNDLDRHDSLKLIFNLADATGRLAHWRLRLSKFEFDLVHYAGIEHQCTNALSRMPMTSEHINPIEDELPVTVNNIDTTKSTKVGLGKHQQVFAQVVEHNDSF